MFGQQLSSNVHLNAHRIMDISPRPKRRREREKEGEGAAGEEDRRREAWPSSRGAERGRRKRWERRGVPFILLR